MGLWRTVLEHRFCHFCNNSFALSKLITIIELVLLFIFTQFLFLGFKGMFKKPFVVSGCLAVYILLVLIEMCAFHKKKYAIIIFTCVIRWFIVLSTILLAIGLIWFALTENLCTEKIRPVFL